MAGIRPFSFIPTNIREWSTFLSQTTVEPSDGTVGDSSFVDRAGVSVIGRSANSAGTPADIVAAVNNRFLVRRASALVFDSLVDTDIPATIARDAEVTAAGAIITAAYIAADAVVLAAAVAAAAAGAASLYAALATTGTYTGAFTGTATDPAPVLRWSKIGNSVLLYVPAALAVSNNTAFTITGAPAAIRPTRTQTVLAIVRDNGTVSIGTASMGTGGTLTLGLGVTSAVFTNSGNKGVELQTLTYSLD